AFAQMPDKKLIILGDGPDSKTVETICKTAPNIEYRGYQEREQLLKTIGQAKAFVFAAEEDFGILPVEAQSLGTPVIAYGVGGVRETVKESLTGVFFEEQTTDSIKQAVAYFESQEDRFDSQVIAQHSQQFSEYKFHHKFRRFVEESYHKFHTQ
ncbi:MAG: glycosyltransferase, partial [Brevinema sp.]